MRRATHIPGVRRDHPRERSVPGLAERDVNVLDVDRIPLQIDPVAVACGPGRRRGAVKRAGAQVVQLARAAERAGVRGVLQLVLRDVQMPEIEHQAEHENKRNYRESDQHGHSTLLAAPWLFPWVVNAFVCHFLHS